MLPLGGGDLELDLQLLQLLLQVSKRPRVETRTDFPRIDEPPFVVYTDEQSADPDPLSFGLGAADPTADALTGVPTRAARWAATGWQSGAGR